MLLMVLLRCLLRLAWFQLVLLLLLPLLTGHEAPQQWCLQVLLPGVMQTPLAPPLAGQVRVQLLQVQQVAEAQALVWCALLMQQASATLHPGHTRHRCFQLLHLPVVLLCLAQLQRAWLLLLLLLHLPVPGQLPCQCRTR
jgi:hypothetical protein